MKILNTYLHKDSRAPHWTFYEDSMYSYLESLWGTKCTTFIMRLIDQDGLQKTPIGES